MLLPEPNALHYPDISVRISLSTHRCAARNFSRVLNLSVSRCHASFARYTVITGTRLAVSTGRSLAKSLGPSTVQTELAKLLSTASEVRQTTLVW